MKKIAVLVMAFAVALLGSACGANNGDAATLTVGASAVPHAEILEHLKPQLEKQGVNLEIKVFQDYVVPNKAVEEGEIDANYFQHIPWMEATNKERGYHISKVIGVHIEPMGAYSKKIKDVSQLKNGATIALPNATSELTRVLLLLDSQKLIQLDNREGDKTLKSIKANPKNLKFQLLEPAMLPRVLDQVDLAVINTNYALQAKLNPLTDALFIEGKDSPYVNVLATKKGNEKNEALQKLAKALTSPETKKFIEEKYKGAVVPAF
ncbi:MetQ/NlpA family ABC transporter substrate-binding protein [Paenactinomyces guangxiensis]|uniref:MetQ/NlpA family ABC transporter substrate-binding protein n=1 Tax=Paenactinomyces guangxiensis TaxID=1490290 RepID=A0A7W2A893_9BACL|nr:MetQ/NlpA family ABC transporter substrate-binding protein [Paenactinomyces guangxiensis]MBA4495376.1 MetQ/NlpA family ABC transporter substrate-binding protein [Paenactinomyces guangxiensis]MBH8592503.1 MetQ/NlpA family ABC transporter substrate-binding protein [Paenactinomyces guangxiensis]